MTDTKYSSEYRNQLVRDVLLGEIPDRVPEQMTVVSAAVLEYQGFDLRTSQYGTTKYAQAINQMNAEFDTDTLIGTFPMNPWYYKILDSERFIMADNGFMQHPDVKSMEEDEYDELIADPVKFMWDKALPRANGVLREPYPQNVIGVIKLLKTQEAYNKRLQIINTEAAIKNNKVTIPLMFRDGGTIPADYLADNLRSFKGMLVDIKRRPDKVLEALSVLEDIFVGSIKKLPEIDRTLRGSTMTHMGTFLKPKEFEKFYWPGFKAIQTARYEAGYSSYILCEDDWMPYIDYLAELPRCELRFEYGDPKLIKEKLGKKHIINGLYPSYFLKTATKEEACDKAKELLDVMAPGGNYIFGFDKSILKASDVNWDNFRAVLECVHEYGKY